MLIAVLKAVKDAVTQGPCAAYCSPQPLDLSITLPLSFVWLLVRYMSHPDPGAKLLELDSPKGLGQEVGELVLGVDVVGPNAPFLQAAPDEVVPHPDVLAALMEDWILSQGQGGLVVHPELHCLCVSAKEIAKQPSQPQSLSRSGSGCDVLCLAAG